LRKDNYITWLHMAEAENISRTGAALAPGMTPEIYHRFLESRVLDTPAHRDARMSLATYIPYSLRTIHLEPTMRAVDNRVAAGEFTHVQNSYIRSLIGRLKGEPSAMTRALVTTFSSCRTLPGQS